MKPATFNLSKHYRQKLAFVELYRHNLTSHGIRIDLESALSFD